jgi:hypothetical protein
MVTSYVPIVRERTSKGRIVTPIEDGVGADVELV